MPINYNGLFNQLKRKNINLSKMSEDLRISSAIRAKFNKGNYVSLRTLESICNYLGVKLCDIVEFETVRNESILYHRLNEEMNHKIKGGIYHETQILLTYNSNHIEGSMLSIDQTRYIFETNTIGSSEKESVNVDDIIETQNHFRCIDYMIETALEPLTEDLIKDLHKILKTGTSDASLAWFAAGNYKNKPNMVGGKDTTKPSEVKNSMEKLIGLYENKENYTFEDIIQFHYAFECIHPFQDGNGRVGRLIAFKECLRHGYIPFTIDESLKMFYYRGLSKWKEERGYLIDTCLTGQDKYKKLLRRFDITLDESEKKL